MRSANLKMKYEIGTPAASRQPTGSDSAYRGDPPRAPGRRGPRPRGIERATRRDDPGWRAIERRGEQPGEPLQKISIAANKISIGKISWFLLYLFILFFLSFFFSSMFKLFFFFVSFLWIIFFFDDNSSGAGLMGSNLVTFMNLWICRKVERATGKGGLTLFLSHTTVIYDIHHDLSFLSLFFLTSFHL